jgi:hypothetical protein
LVGVAGGVLDCAGCKSARAFGREGDLHPMGYWMMQDLLRPLEQRTHPEKGLPTSNRQRSILIRQASQSCRTSYLEWSKSVEEGGDCELGVDMITGGRL